MVGMIAERQESTKFPKKTTKKFQSQIIMVELNIGLFIAVIVLAISMPGNPKLTLKCRTTNDTRDSLTYTTPILYYQQMNHNAFPILHLETIQNLNPRQLEFLILSTSSALASFSVNSGAHAGTPVIITFNR